MGIGKFGWAWLVSHLFITSLFAVDPGCAGIVAEIFPLGGMVRVEPVELISAEESAILEKYSQGLSVQEQLRAPQTFGFVAVRDERIAGYIVVEKSNRFLSIKNIGVAKDFRQRGVGRDLVEKAISEARGMQEIEDVRVMVAVSDESIRRFFSQVGMTETEIIPGKFNGRATSGVLLKIALKPDARVVAMNQPQLQLAPQPKPRPKLMLQTIAITREELLKLDPTLENAD